jgi:hypothetical protein
VSGAAQGLDQAIALAERGATPATAGQTEEQKRDTWSKQAIKRLAEPRDIGNIASDRGPDHEQARDHFAQRSR